MFNHIKNATFIILGSAILAIFTYTAIAFTEPTQAPPQGNVPSPINVGSSAQTKSGALTINNAFTVGGAGTFAQLCLGGSCRSLWSDIFNPSGDYSGSGLRAASANSANTANSAATANTLQGYTVGSGANQIPVTDGSGRLDANIMPSSISGICGWHRNGCPSGTVGGVRGPITKMIALQYIRNNFGKFRTLNDCNNARACEVSLGGNAVRVSSENYIGVAIDADNYYDSNNNCNPAPAYPYSPAYIYYADYECRVDNLYFCCSSQ